MAFLREDDSADWSHYRRLPAASFRDRAIAVHAETVVMVPIFSILLLISGGFNLEIKAESWGSTNNKLLLSLLPSLLMQIIYAVPFEISPWRGTLGKRWLGLRVINEDGSALSFTQALMRNIYKIVFTACLGLSYWVMLFDANHQTLHDKLSRTRVIKYGSS